MAKSMGTTLSDTLNSNQQSSYWKRVLMEDTTSPQHTMSSGKTHNGLD